MSYKIETPLEGMDTSRYIPGAIMMNDGRDDMSFSSSHHHAHGNDECCSDELETEDFVFTKVLLTFSQYERYYFDFFDTKICHFQKVWNQVLDSEHAVSSVLPNQFQVFANMKAAIQTNYTNLILKILESHAIGFEDQKFAVDVASNINDGGFSKALNMKPRVLKVTVPVDTFLVEEIIHMLNSEDFEKVNSTVKQFVRDWSLDGKVERDNSYQLIVNEIKRIMPLNGTLNKYKVLTPGSGLGRLTWEIAREGYSSQGNEFSFHMLLGSNLILNNVYREADNSVGFEQFEIYPYVTQMSNLFSRSDQMRAVHLPDIHPGDALPDGVEFSMVAGDFIEVYQNEEQRSQWDCVATCFFIDTASNIFDYLKTIHQCLKVGGYWVNLGPLLWHHHEMGDSRFSVELTLEEIKEVAAAMGFEFIAEREIETTYISSGKRSMGQTVYNCAFFTAQKKR